LELSARIYQCYSSATRQLFQRYAGFNPFVVVAQVIAAGVLG